MLNNTNNGFSGVCYPFPSNEEQESWPRWNNTILVRNKENCIIIVFMNECLQQAEILSPRGCGGKPLPVEAEAARAHHAYTTSRLMRSRSRNLLAFCFYSLFTWKYWGHTSFPILSNMVWICIVVPQNEC